MGYRCGYACATFEVQEALVARLPYLELMVAMAIVVVVVEIIEPTKSVEASFVFSVVKEVVQSVLATTFLTL